MHDFGFVDAVVYFIGVSTVCYFLISPEIFPGLRKFSRVLGNFPVSPEIFPGPRKLSRKPSNNVICVNSPVSHINSVSPIVTLVLAAREANDPTV